jgi:hypothetical protein
MKHKYIAAVISFVLISAACSSWAAPLDFPKYGFQIGALDATPGSVPTQAVMLFLPAKDGFAPNVNVMIQPYADTMKDYISLSKSQFDQMKMKVISEKSPSDNEWLVEYVGEYQQSSLHWYARAALKQGKVYLVTGTSRASDWDIYKSDLKKCVDSFTLK